MQFTDLARTFDAIESTSARRELVALLAELFGSADDDELQPLIYLCQGRLAPAFVPLEFGMAEKTVADAIAQASYPGYGRLRDPGLSVRAWEARGLRRRSAAGGRLRSRTR